MSVLPPWLRPIVTWRHSNLEHWQQTQPYSYREGLNGLKWLQGIWRCLNVQQQFPLARCLYLKFLPSASNFGTLSQKVCVHLRLHCACHNLHPCTDWYDWMWPGQALRVTLRVTSQEDGALTYWTRLVANPLAIIADYPTPGLTCCTAKCEI